MIAAPGESYQHEVWHIGSLSEACDAAYERAKLLRRPQKVKLLRGYPVQMGRIWIIVDQYGLQIMY